MAGKYYTTGDANTQKLWAKRTIAEALRGSVFGLLHGEDPDCAIVIQPETSREPGDRVRTRTRRQLTGRGKQGSQTLKGNEEGLEHDTDDLLIDTRRHAVQVHKNISEQRTTIKQVEESRKSLSDWFDDMFSFSALNQLCGKTTEADTLYTGNNTVTAPDANHIVRAGAAADDGAVASGTHAPTLSLLDKCVAFAESYSLADGNGAPIRRAKVKGLGELYVFICHPYFWHAMKTSSSGNEYTDLAKAFYQGSGDNNPLAKTYRNRKARLVAIYNDVAIVTDPRCPKGVHSGADVANTRRGVFLGAGAATLAFGMHFGTDKMRWNEEIDDYGELHGIAGTTVYGLKKNIYNSKDWASIVVTGYTALG